MCFVLLYAISPISKEPSGSADVVVELFCLVKSRTVPNCIPTALFMDDSGGFPSRLLSRIRIQSGISFFPYSAGVQLFTMLPAPRPKKKPLN